MEFDELSQLASKYGTGKFPVYTPYYYSLFKDIKYKVKKVAEMGIGFWEMAKIWNGERGPETYTWGASLKMWRDFFPNAQIYGGDNRERIMFEDERIKTFVCDERREDNLKQFIKNTGSDLDIFVDDARHDPESQIYMCKKVMPLLQKDVIYVIEDLTEKTIGKVVNSLTEYDLDIPVLESPSGIKGGYLKPGKLLIVRNR